MPHPSTGRPRGTGRLGLGEYEDHGRVSVRLPAELHARVLAFAAGRCWPKPPRLAESIRILLDAALAHLEAQALPPSVAPLSTEKPPKRAALSPAQLAEVVNAL